MRRLGWLLPLLASAALAGAPGGQSVGGTVSRGNFLRIPVYSTPGDGNVVTYFVDPTGSDGNTCTSTGTGACLTIQGAINKIPKLLRDQVTVNVAAGNYAGFLVSGFTVDNGVQQTTGGLLIDGALTTSTLATGSATGTATAGSAGSGSTWGTLTDAAANWTVNDLKGRFITTATPTNTGNVIVSNTQTIITIAGTWSAPTASTTYTIQDPSVILTTAGPSQPATPTQAANANRAAIQSLGNLIAYRSNGIVFRNMRVAPAAGAGLELADPSSYRLVDLQIRPAAATATGIFYGSNFTAPTVVISNCDVSLGTSNNGISSSGGTIDSNQVVWRNSSNAGAAVLVATGFGVSSAASVLFRSSDTSGFLNGIRIVAGSVQGGGFTGNHITCGTSAGIGISVGSSTTNIASAPGAATPIDTTIMSTCGTARQVVGPIAADVTGMTGSVGTTGFAVYLGGLVSFSKAGTTFTAGTNEVNLDSGGVTAAFSDVTAGTCISGGPTGSRVCGR